MTRLQHPAPTGVLVSFVLLLMAGSASGQDLDGSSDHPLLSRFPGSEIIGYDQRTHDQTYIPSQPNLEAGEWVAGRLTWIAYKAPMNSSVLQLYRNYEKALNNAGFTTAYACRKEECGKNFVKNMLQITGRYINRYDKWMPGTISYLGAKLPSDAGDTWVSLAIYELDRQGQPIVRQEIVETNAPRALDVLAAANVGEKSVEYDEARIAAGVAESRKLPNVLDLEGKVDWNVYRYANDVSPYEAFASWAKYATDNGFSFDFSCAKQQCGSRFIKNVVDLNGNIADGGEKWSQNSGYYFLARSVAGEKSTYLGVLTYKQPNGIAVSRSLAVVTDTPDFDQIRVNAESLAAEIEEKGKVAVYGIYFDTDKAEVKPDSAPTLSEIARLMSMRPQLSLFVDGHTDNQGADDYNLELSRLRSTAVVTALVKKHGVDGDRLESRGFGMTSPVESNDTIEGRAKNRRVELVAKTPL